MADQILAHLVSEGMKVGDWLPSEHQWMAMTGAGRSSVREALQLLVGIGLIEARPGRGYIITKGINDENKPAAEPVLTEQQLSELNECRLILECEGAALAAVRGTEREFADLAGFLDSIAPIAATAKTIYPQTITFHLQLIKAAHNQTLYEMIESIMPKIAMVGEQVAHQVPLRAPIDLEIHRVLLNEVRSRDPERAKAAMRTHLQDASLLYDLPLHPNKSK